MIRRSLIALIALSTLVVLGGGVAFAQAPVSANPWQSAADSARFALVAPSPPGFVLQDLTIDSPACEGNANALIRAQFRRADGALIVVEQYDGECDLTYGDVVGEIPLRGISATVLQLSVGECFLAPDAAPCAVQSDGELGPQGRGIVYDSGGVEVIVSSNLASHEPLAALLETAPVVSPAPGLGPLFERFQATVLRVVAPDRLVVRANGVVRGVRLAGLRAPQGKQCWAPQALRYAKRLMPPGRVLWFEDDPSAGKRFWLYRGYGDGEVPSRDPVNARLVEAGAATVAAGRWRHSLTSDLRIARGAKYGIWGKTCGGSFKPKPKPTPKPVGFVSPSPRPAPAPSRPARSDIYNCSDFPLSDGTSAQTYLNLYPDDPSGLDGDGDGYACEG